MTNTQFQETAPNTRANLALSSSSHKPIERSSDVRAHGPWNWRRHAILCEAAHERTSEYAPTTPNPLPRRASRTVPPLNLPKQSLKKELAHVTSAISEQPTPSPNTVPARMYQSKRPHTKPATHTHSPKPGGLSKSAEEKIRVMEWAKKMAIATAERAVQQERAVQAEQKFKMLLCKWKVDAMEKNDAKGNMKTEDVTPSVEEDWLWHYVYKREGKWMKSTELMLRERGVMVRRGLGRVLEGCVKERCSEPCYVRF